MGAQCKQRTACDHRLSLAAVNTMQRGPAGSVGPQCTHLLAEGLDDGAADAGSWARHLAREAGCGKRRGYM